MNHFLAYGNSDQVSFRDPEVHGSFQFMTVPGTIAAYYADATAAFVLSSELNYVIDLRTPLFQAKLVGPRASHYALGAWLGTAVAARMTQYENEEVTPFPAEFYDDSVVREMTSSVIEHQRAYAGRAPAVTARIDRYRRLAAEAQGRPVDADSGRPAKPPSFTLAPYFAARQLGSDPWWELTQRVWGECTRQESADEISPVIAVSSPYLLREAVSSVPAGLSGARFFWITDFDERRVSVDDLVETGTAIHELTSGTARMRLVNMYGGFFSICLDHLGLWGFSNGLGYSESRAWPELTSTGAAPPRYYIRSLHAFASPAVAQLLVDAGAAVECSCSACTGTRRRGGTIVGMNYHLLKRHFALARRWEMELAANLTVADLSEHLREEERRYRAAARASLPPTVRVGTAHLGNWATALDELAS